MPIEPIRTATLAAISLLLACSGVAQVAEVKPSASAADFDVQRVEGWGATPNVSRLGTMYFAGQVDEDGLEAAKAAGVATVLNLRAPSESSFDERAAAEARGLRYFNVPVTGDRFEDDAFAEIERIVGENKDGGILIHCASSNRVGGWLATHLVTTQGLGIDEAIEVGREAGITSPRVEERAREYLSRHGAP